jgi:polyphenol oxidase
VKANSEIPDTWLTATGLPVGVRAFMTTRAGGVSPPPYDSLNLRPTALRGDAWDDPVAVAENAARVAAVLGATPVWLDQVHGVKVVRLTEDSPPGPLPRADASISTDPSLACAVLVADCLPVLFATPDGGAVAAAHAGWRGLAGGVLEATVEALCDAARCKPQQLHAWLGACIGPEAFEVGPDVLAAFGRDPQAQAALGQADRRFAWAPRADGTPRWRADLAGLAHDRLQATGVSQVAGGGWCTVSDASRFFSYRRSAITGRMAACIRPARIRPAG